MAMSPDVKEFLTKLADRQACEGVLYEPRIYFDIFDYNSGDDSRKVGHPDVFRNGEKYPVRLTHITAAMLAADAASPNLTPVQGDERMIQRFKLRVRAHDDWYMGESFIPIPLWNNKCQAANDVVTRGTASWKFDKPIYLAQRDTMEIRVQLETATTNGARTVGVAFNGVGAYSRRPKQLAATTNLTGVNIGHIESDNFRNDGLEPLEIHEAVFSCSAEADDGDPTGDIRQLRVEIKQRGNGTNEWWNVGPVITGDRVDSAASNQGSIRNTNLCPAVLLGQKTGRCVVHQLPETVPNVDGNRGWFLEPGEGLTVELDQVTGSRNESVGVAMLGYVIVV